MVLFLTFFLIHSALVEKNNQNEPTNTTECNGANKYDLWLKLKELELQNVKIQKSLDELKHMMTDSSNRGPSATNFPKNCKEVRDRGDNVTDIYRIQPDPTSGFFFVLCDMSTWGGGWTYVLNRHDGSQNFDLGWNEYKLGFGNLGGVFWLGLENLRKLIASSQVSELLVELVDWDAQKAYALCIGSEQEGYILKFLGPYSGDAGDSFADHVGMKFTTKDRDNDLYNIGNCAELGYGGWWYDCKLTGRYLKRNLTSRFDHQGIYWSNFRGITYSLKVARMMVRPRNDRNPMMLPYKSSNN